MKGKRDFAASYVANKTHNYMSPHPGVKFREVMGQGVLEYLLEGSKIALQPIKIIPLVLLRRL